MATAQQTIAGDRVSLICSARMEWTKVRRKAATQKFKAQIDAMCDGESQR
jgi:hypothetical protein